MSKKPKKNGKDVTGVAGKDVTGSNVVPDGFVLVSRAHIENAIQALAWKPEYLDSQLVLVLVNEFQKILKATPAPVSVPEPVPEEPVLEGKNVEPTVGGTAPN